MRLTYKIPAGEAVSFQIEFVRDQGKKIMPGWIHHSLALVFWGANFLLALWLTATVDHAIALICLLWLIYLLWHKGFAFVHRKMASRYIASLPDSELWTSEVVGDKFVTGSRGLTYSFPLSELSHIYEQGEYLYLEFPDIGRARIPFNAFQSPSERCEFVQMLESKKAPAKAPEPPPAAGAS